MYGNLDLVDYSSAVAEWSRAPTSPPREGGGAGSDPDWGLFVF